MNLITKKEKIAKVASRWYKAYFCSLRHGEWYMNSPLNRKGKTKEEIYNTLIEKKPETEQEVIDIVGNRSWTSNCCDECGKESDILVVIGQEPNYESDTASICKNCLEKALEMVKDSNV